MLYFSELRNKPVFTEDKIPLGKLEDLIFLATETPKVSKLIIKDKNNKILSIPVEFIHKINHQIILKKNYLQEDLVANELYVLKNLLDKQIIDLKGQKIVRVNDIVIQEQPFLSVAGVDIGILGVIRQFKIEKSVNKLLSFFKIRLASRFLSWGDIQPIELAYGRVSLKIKEEKLEKIRPEDLADYLEKTNVLNVGKILKILDDRSAAEVINYLNINFQSSIFRHFPIDRSAKILSLMDSDEAVDVILTFSAKKQEQILLLIDNEKRKEIQYLLKLAKTPIGNIISTEFIAVDSRLTVREIFEKIKKNTPDFAFLYYVYVINNENQLIGVISLHELILQDLDTPIYKFTIQNLVVIHLTTPKEIAVKKMIKYRLHSLPVIDESKHILGIVSIDDLEDIVMEKII